MGAYKTESELLAAGRVIMRMNIPMWKGSTDQQCNSLNDCTGLTMVSPASSDLIISTLCICLRCYSSHPKTFITHINSSAWAIHTSIRDFYMRGFLPSGVFISRDSFPKALTFGVFSCSGFLRSGGLLHTFLS